MRLGEVIERWRHDKRLGIRGVAAEIGISPATLSRIERDEAMDGATLTKILIWLFGEQEKTK